MNFLALLDLIAGIFFFLSWIGYGYYAKHKARTKSSLLGVMPGYRKIWMENMLERENKMIDAMIIGNLMRMITFFASTTILIIAAIFAGLGSIEAVGRLTANLPWVPEVSIEVQEARFIVLLIIFIYAFFKFTWSLRQNNFVSILIGSTNELSEDENTKYIVEKTSRLESLAANSFNNSLRAYYFALAVLAWFLHPVLFMLATIGILFVLNRREFHSQTLSILSSNENS